MAKTDKNKRKPKDARAAKSQDNGPETGAITAARSATVSMT